MTRVYVNWFDDPERLFWAVDSGPGTTSLLVHSVEFSSISSGRMVIDEDIMLSDAREKELPKAWLQVDDGVYSIEGRHAIVRSSHRTT